jgi:hypothetical protein
VWCADERTLVFTIFEEIKSVPAVADPSTSRFAPGIGEHFLNRLTVGTQVWSVAQTERLSLVLSMLQRQSFAQPVVNILGAQGLDSLSNLLRVSAWTQFSADIVTCQAEAECKDSGAAKKLKDLLAERALESQKMPASPEGKNRFKRLLDDLERELKIEQKDTLVTLNAEFSVAAINQALAPPTLSPQSRSRGRISIE